MGSTCDELHGPYDGIPIPRAHAACYVAVPEIELVGLCDTWPDQREAARRKWGIDAVYADYRRMLEATKPDIVSVCTTAKPRAEIMLAIADGGYGVRAIWAEKPITFSLEEADRVIHACEKAGITLAVNCSRRWDDKYNQALRMVDDGLIGDVLHVVALAQCGLSHNGSHLLTTLTMFTGARAAWVMGEVEGPSVVGVRHGGDREKMFEAADAAASSDADFEGAGYVGFPNGVRGYFRGISNGPNEWAFDITGTRGMLRILHDGWTIEHWTNESLLRGMTRGAPARRFFPPPRTRRSVGINTVCNLLDCMDGRAVPKCSGEDAREALEIAIATRESHRRGNARVSLPLPDRSLRIISREATSDVPRRIQRERLASGSSIP